MLRISSTIVFTICFLVLLSGVANAYFISATDGPNLYLFRAEKGSNGKISITAEFKYAAPGLVGNTVLIPVPGTSSRNGAAILAFDLFATFQNAANKPQLFRDRVEFDDATRTFRQVSRQLFSHKLDSYNVISGAVRGQLNARSSAITRELLTKNGLKVSRKSVNSAGNVTGASKTIFKNSSNKRTLAAALSSDGELAIQSTFTSSSLQPGSKAAGASGAQMTFGVEIASLVGPLIKRIFAVASEPPNVSVEQDTDKFCAVTRDQQRGSRAQGEGARAVDKTRILYNRFDRATLQLIDNTRSITKLGATTLTAHEVFNTSGLLPDATGIWYGKQKGDKLVYFLKPLDGPCGVPTGQPVKIFPDGTIQNNSLLRGMALAACLDPNLGIC